MRVVSNTGRRKNIQFLTYGSAEYVGSRDVGLIYLYQDVRLIKRQKCVKKKVSGLTRDAVAAMLAAPDPATSIGKRDLVFMILLYATAARLDEILSVKIKQIHLEEKKKPYITIVGKGRKARTLYLLPKAVSHIKKYICEVHGNKADPYTCKIGAGANPHSDSSCKRFCYTPYEAGKQESELRVKFIARSTL